MKRREAIQNIFLLSAGMALVPGCQMKENGLVYANVPLESGQRTLIDLLTNTILPRTDTAITTPETTTDFILTMLNDCAAPEDIQQYLTGIKEFTQGVKNLYNTSFKSMAVDKQIALFNDLGKSEKMTEAAKFFFNATNNMTRQHFIGSEHFMKELRDFEFAPARYIGCQEI